MTNWAPVAKHRPDVLHILRERISVIENQKTPVAVRQDKSNEGLNNHNLEKEAIMQQSNNRLTCPTWCECPNTWGFSAFDKCVEHDHTLRLHVEHDDVHISVDQLEQVTNGGAKLHPATVVLAAADGSVELDPDEARHIVYVLTEAADIAEAIQEGRFTSRTLTPEEALRSAPHCHGCEKGTECEGDEA